MELRHYNLTLTTHQATENSHGIVMRAHAKLPSAIKSITFSAEYLQDCFFGKLVQSSGFIFTSDALIKSNSA